MRIQELAEKFGDISLDKNQTENFFDIVINQIENEFGLSENATHKVESILYYASAMDKNNNFFTNLNDWINNFEPSDYYYSEDGDFDRNSVKEDKSMLLEIAGDCDEAIMDAFENDGDPDWQLAYEAMSRIALTLEDIDFNVEKLDLDEQLAQKSKNKRQ